MQPLPFAQRQYAIAMFVAEFTHAVMTKRMRGVEGPLDLVGMTEGVKANLQHMTMVSTMGNLLQAWAPGMMQNQIATAVNSLVAPLLQQAQAALAAITASGKADAQQLHVAKQALDQARAASARQLAAAQHATAAAGASATPQALAQNLLSSLAAPPAGGAQLPSALAKKTRFGAAPGAAATTTAQPPAAASTVTPTVFSGASVVAALAGAGAPPPPPPPPAGTLATTGPTGLVRQHALPAWAASLTANTKIKDGIIPVGAITSDQQAKTAFQTLCIISKKEDPNTFPIPEWVPCFYSEVMVAGCKSTKCFACGRRASWIAIPTGVVPKIRAAAVPSTQARMKVVP